VIIIGYSINDYFIDGHWLLNYHKLLMVIGGYFIDGH
jgi:hypothetical protein